MREGEEVRDRGGEYEREGGTKRDRKDMDRVFGLGDTR